jgi:hypothetical protein
MKYGYAIQRIMDTVPGLNPKDVAARLRQSTYVSLSKRYMYFEIPKAACTQLKHVLRGVEGAGPLRLFADPKIRETRRDMFVHARVNVPLPSLADVDNVAQREVLESPDFLRMTVVRNPYSRLISAWKSKVVMCEPLAKAVYVSVKGRLPYVHENWRIAFQRFVEYVEDTCDLSDCDVHWKRQVDHTYFAAMNFSLVGRVEQLNESLRQLEHHVGPGSVPSVRGMNESLPIGDAEYSRELADRVYALYRRDFETLKYKQDSWVVVDRRNGGRQPEGILISEERLRDEIVERNLLILELYEERHRMQGQLRWASRLGLLPMVNGLIALGSLRRKLRSKLKVLVMRAQVLLASCSK